MGCLDWHTAMHSVWLQMLLWIYCPGHAWVRGNEQADRVASTADITSAEQAWQGRDTWRLALRNFLNMDRPEHHSIDYLKEREVERGSSWLSILQGWEKTVFNQTNTSTVLTELVLGSLGETAERWCGAQIGLHEHYSAIFSVNWKLSFQYISSS